MTSEEYLEYFQQNWPLFTSDGSHTHRFSAMRKCITDAAEKNITDKKKKRRVQQLARGSCFQAMAMAFREGVPPEEIGPALMLIVSSGPVGRQPNYAYSKNEMKP